MNRPTILIACALILVVPVLAQAGADTPMSWSSLKAAYGQDAAKEFLPLPGSYSTDGSIDEALADSVIDIIGWKTLGKYSRVLVFIPGSLAGTGQVAVSSTRTDGTREFFVVDTRTAAGVVSHIRLTDVDDIENVVIDDLLNSATFGVEALDALVDAGAADEVVTDICEVLDIEIETDGIRDAWNSAKNKWHILSTCTQAHGTGGAILGFGIVTGILDGIDGC